VSMVRCRVLVHTDTGTGAPSGPCSMWSENQTSKRS
jgi:hypothetical protein